MDGPAVLSMPPITAPPKSAQSPQPQSHSKSNQVSTVSLYGIHIVSLVIEGQERLCLAQISNTLLKQFSYNEIHNRRVALGITCVQCTPVQLEILRRAGAMPVSSRRCGMITRREAERLCKSFLGDNAPPRLPEDFAFSVHHECAWGCRGHFLPARYNSSRAKCIKCTYCGLFFSPNKFIFHSHRIGPSNKYVQPDAANFNSWRRHMKLSGNQPDDVVHAWEDVKAMFNGGTRKRLLNNPSSRESPIPTKRPASAPTNKIPALVPSPTHPRVPPFPELPLPLSRSLVMDYMWHQHQQAAAVAAAKTGNQPDDVAHAWEDVKAMFNGETRKRLLNNPTSRESPIPSRRPRSYPTDQIPALVPSPTHPRVPPFPELPLPLSRSLDMDYVWHQHQQAAAVAAAKTPGFPFPPYALPWLAKRGPVLFPGPLPPPISGSSPTEPLIPTVNPSLHQSAFRPVIRGPLIVESVAQEQPSDASVTNNEVNSDDEVDIETTEDDPVTPLGIVQNLHSASKSTSSGHSGRNSPQCWSPPQETEREAEKIAEETCASTVREVTPELQPARSPDNWQGNNFYRHLDAVNGPIPLASLDSGMGPFLNRQVKYPQGNEPTERTGADCSACRPRGIFYGQIHSPPASTNNNN